MLPNLLTKETNYFWNLVDLQIHQGFLKDNEGKLNEIFRFFKIQIDEVY